MRKLIISTTIVAALLTTLGATAAVAVFENARFATPAGPSKYSIHVVHNGRALGHPHAPLLTL